MPDARGGRICNTAALYDPENIPSGTDAP